MIRRSTPAVRRTLSLLLVLTAAVVVAAEEAAQLSPAALIDRDLQPLDKLLQNMRRKIDSGVAGVASNRHPEVSGWVSGCCSANVVRLRRRSARLEATGRVLQRAYAGRFDENGSRLTRELLQEVARFRELLEVLASATDRGRSIQSLQRLDELLRAINQRKKGLADCCSGFTVSAPPEVEGG